MVHCLTGWTITSVVVFSPPRSIYASKKLVSFETGRRTCTLLKPGSRLKDFSMIPGMRILAFSFFPMTNILALDRHGLSFHERDIPEIESAICMSKRIIPLNIQEFFVTIKLSITSICRSLFRMVSSASRGWYTTGYPWRLNYVFSTTADNGDLWELFDKAIILRILASGEDLGSNSMIFWMGCSTASRIAKPFQ